MKKLLTFLFVLWTISVHATTYTISPTGSDANNGSAASPFKSLYKACSVAKNGDIIHVNAGTYIETQTSNLAVGVSIEGEGATSIIKASFSAIYQMIIQASSAEGTNGNQHISKIKMDGQGSTSWAIQIQGRSNFEIHDCTITGFKQRGIVWGGREDNSDNPPGIYATGNKFYNNIVTNCASFDGTYGYGCLNIGGQDGMLIYNNTIVTTGSTPGWPIKLWNDGHIKGCKIYNNTLKRPPFPYQYNGIGNYFDFAIEMFYPEGLEIYGNTIEGSIDLDWQLKGSYGYSVWIHDNIIGRSTQAAHCETGIWLENSSEFVTIERNTFKSISQPIMFSLRPGSYMNDITIQKNLAYNIGKTDGTRQGTAIGIIVNDDSQNYTAENVSITGNNFIALSGNNNPWFGVVIPGGTSSKNITFSNNVVSGFNYQPLVCYTGNHINGMVYKDNIVYGGTVTLGNPVNLVQSNNRNIDPQLNANYISALGVGYGGNVPPPPTACTYTYSAWGACVNGLQTRTVTSATPAGCTGTPILTQACVPPPPPTKTLVSTTHIYSDGTVSTAKAVNKKKTLLFNVKAYSDGSYEIEN